MVVIALGIATQAHAQPQRADEPTWVVGAAVGPARLVRSGKDSFTGITMRVNAHAARYLRPDLALGLELGGGLSASNSAEEFSDVGPKTQFSALAFAEYHWRLLVAAAGVGAVYEQAYDAFYYRDPLGLSVRSNDTFSAFGIVGMARAGVELTSREYRVALFLVGEFALQRFASQWMWHFGEEQRWNEEGHTLTIWAGVRWQ